MGAVLVGTGWFGVRVPYLEYEYIIRDKLWRWKEKRKRKKRKKMWGIVGGIYMRLANGCKYWFQDRGAVCRVIHSDVEGKDPDEQMVCGMFQKCAGVGYL